MGDRVTVSRVGTHYGQYRQNSSGAGTYYVDENDNVYAPGADSDYPAWLNALPKLIGKWIGKGVDAYKKESTNFERFWNSPDNQFSQWEESPVNPFEGFLSGSGGNGNPISPDGSDPLAMLGGYLSNFISLAHGLADLRSKNLANNSSAIDLLRKQFENKWFFGSPGEIVTESYIDDEGKPQVLTVKKGYIQSKPERDYEGQRTQNKRSSYQEVVDRFHALKHQHAIDMGYPARDADSESDSKYYKSLDDDYRQKRNNIEYEWENFLKNEIGVDPHAPWWLTTLLRQGDKFSGMDNVVGRFLYGIMQFLKGNY